MFIKEIQINSNQKIKVLHIAPEHKISAWFLKQTSVEYIAGDKFTKGYVYPDYTIDIDILNTKFNDNTFNAIICNHVLEHIPDDIAAMTEIFRILKAGGRGILQVPLAYGLDKTVEDLSVKTESEREIKFGQYDHVRLYGLDYTDRLKQCGFEVNVVSPEIFLTKTEIEKSAINPSENIFTVLKK
jgi:SAM-dependent methyltransferase